MDDRTAFANLNDDPPDPNGRYVLYWMQQSQRAAFNHALEYAARCGRIEREQGLDRRLRFDRYLSRGQRTPLRLHAGRPGRGQGCSLHDRGIKFVVRRGSLQTTSHLTLAKNASLVVCDRGYLRHQTVNGVNAVARRIRQTRGSRWRVTPSWCRSRVIVG